jgi:prevent-host-death family protein
MKVSVSEAKGQLTELVRRAEAGDEVILTRRGHPTVRLVPMKRKLSPEERDAVIRSVQKSAVKKAKPGPCAARSQDFLYDERGLPA